jgi:hypothetical protein
MKPRARSLILARVSSAVESFTCARSRRDLIFVLRRRAATSADLRAGEGNVGRSACPALVVNGYAWRGSMRAGWRCATLLTSDPGGRHAAAPYRYDIRRVTRFVGWRCGAIKFRGQYRPSRLGLPQFRHRRRTARLSGCLSRQHPLPRLDVRAPGLSRSVGALLVEK